MLEDYQRLLAEGLVRPSKLELWVADADGDNARQVTYLDAASFAPYFTPSGDRILFSTNYGDPQGREFDIWAVNVDGSNLERITYAPGFDGFPMFSPDGRWLAFSSNRNQAQEGWTDVYVARWIGARTANAENPVDQLKKEVQWLADDERQGRGIGTEGLAQATTWMAEQFAELGLEPGAGEGTFLQPFDVPVRIHSGENTALLVSGEPVAEENFVVASFTTSGQAEGEVVQVGYGISAPELDYDDYADVDVNGKIALVRRFTPTVEAFSGEKSSADRRRYGDLRYKAWNAREHGAVGVLLVDLPVVEEGAAMPAESPLPSLKVETRADAGLPVLIIKRAVAEPLFSSGHQAEMTVEVEVERQATRNVVARLPARGEAPLPGALLVGAHIDHLGFGGAGSLAPGEKAPHNGADDNASGTAALLEIGRRLMTQQEELRRDVYLVAFSGEESGLRGSTHFTQNPPEGLAIEDLMAMVNLDMVGRLRNNRVSALGGNSALEWEELLPPLCHQSKLLCKLGGDGYGPSDQTPFFAAGVPVLHFFTGTHTDYHRPSDDTQLLNFAGTVQIAAVVADLAAELSIREQPLTYQTAAAPEPRGDSRSYGASLGTIPDYASDDVQGVLLAGTRPEGPADQAGMQRGDLVVELAGHEVRDIYDLMFVLRQAKPGETTSAVVERDGERIALEVTFGQSRGMR